MISEIKHISATDSRQSLLKEIRLGTKLRSVDISQSNQNKTSKPSANQKQLINSSDAINQNSFNSELQDQIKKRTQFNELNGGQQSYFRWSNTNNNANNIIDSTLNQRTRFQTPPVPMRRTSLHANPTLNSINKSIDRLESDFSDYEVEEEVEQNSNEKQKSKFFEPIITITKKRTSIVQP